MRQVEPANKSLGCQGLVPTNLLPSAWIARYFKIFLLCTFLFGALFENRKVLKCTESTDNRRILMEAVPGKHQRWWFPQRSLGLSDCFDNRQDMTGTRFSKTFRVFQYFKSILILFKCAITLILTHGLAHRTDWIYHAQYHMPHIRADPYKEQFDTCVVIAK